jgi:hypothetical protein
MRYDPGDLAGALCGEALEMPASARTDRGHSCARSESGSSRLPLVCGARLSANRRTASSSDRWAT